MNQAFMTETGRLLHRAKFSISCSESTQYPIDDGFEIAFVGRSNSGKSSAINTITQKRKLAFSSKTPGRTQLINFFELDADRRLVDVPGYGFASASVKVQRAWSKNLEDYFAVRKCLVGLVWLMDIRHPMQPHDQLMLQWLADMQIPTQLLLSKSDKLTRNRANQVLYKMKKELGSLNQLDIQMQTFSSLKKEGLDPLFDRLANWFGLQEASLDGGV